MRIIVTAGPTREAIDPVRFISNRSTGKMGYAVARVCARRGHDVVLISGPVSIKPPRAVRTVKVVTADDMLEAVKAGVSSCDVLIMTAAVSDFRPKTVSKGKIKKRSMPRSIPLVPTADILTTMMPLKKDRIYVGFAAETSNVVKEAARKLKGKKLDLIVANDVTRRDSGFGTDTNKVMFLSADGAVKRFPVMTKDQVAGRILDWVEKRKNVASENA